MNDSLSRHEVEQFILSYGRHRDEGRRLIEALQKKRPFVEAIQSEVGMELLKDLLVVMNKLLSQIIDNTATEDEKAEYRVCYNLLITWAERLQSYNDSVGNVRQKINKSEEIRKNG
jgi:hypothetical protein